MLSLVNNLGAFCHSVPPPASLFQLTITATKIYQRFRIFIYRIAIYSQGNLVKMRFVQYVQISTILVSQLLFGTPAFIHISSTLKNRMGTITHHKNKTPGRGLTVFPCSSCGRIIDTLEGQLFALCLFS